MKFNFNQPLNEAKDTSYRTVDDKTWSSISSICSRNKDTEAENVKPMSKLSKEDLVNRYAAALVIMKKPCPVSEADIERLRSFKNYAYAALQAGATMSDLQRAYNINAGLGDSMPSVSVDNGANDEIDPHDRVLNNIINNTKSTINNEDDDEDIDPNDRILNNIIDDGKATFDRDTEFDMEDVRKFIGTSPNNTIECPVRRSDYATEEDFIKGFNNYLRGISTERVVSKPNSLGNIGYTTKRYLEYGNLISVQGIDPERPEFLYVRMKTTEPRYDLMSYHVSPLSMPLFRKYRIWENDNNRVPQAFISDSFVATKLIDIFNKNGFNVRELIVNDTIPTHKA